MNEGARIQRQPDPRCVTEAEAFEFGPFRLDPLAGVLTRTGVPESLGPRAVAVLAHLLAHANTYVSKQSLMDAAWPGAVVEESNLSVQISSIRRVLGQIEGRGGSVETLARRGYRFVGPVTALRDSALQGAAVDRQRSNLPASLTSFVGRERELVEIKRLLAKTRLLTVVGAGGIGKTRFALQAANEVTAAYRDGVWLVDLSVLSDPSLVPSAVARALGVREIPGRPLLETLSTQLAGRQALLLLDNCEHLVEACAHLVDTLLQQAAELTVLATSREALSLAGEQVYALPTLSLPDANPTIEDVARSEAVQLFIERAQTHKPDFALTTERAPVVAQVCIRLDGIPLALELAAARIRSLSIEQINARLDDRFDLLTGGKRKALPRQQTLRATLDWSYDLLADRDRTVLRRLGVFASGFTLDAACFVAADGVIDQLAVTDVLDKLVERSLVVADTDSADARYRLLETTRAYALEKLAESGETEAIRGLHAQHFRVQLDGAAQDWLTLREAEWHARYLPELDNVRAALDWAFGRNGDPAIGIGLCAASGPIWLELALAGEGRQRIKTAIARLEQTPERDQARMWLWLGMLWGDAAPDESIRAKSRAIELYRQLGDASGLGFSLVQRALMLCYADRFDEVDAALAEALPLLKGSGLPRALARHSEISGLLMMRRGDLAGARTHYEEALTLYRRIGVEREVLRMLGNQADLTWALGELDAAIEEFREAIAIGRASKTVTGGTLGPKILNLAGVYTERGELDEALAAAREGLPYMKRSGTAWINMDHLALRAALAGDCLAAVRLAGYVDHAYSAKQAARGPNELRARTRLTKLLSERFAASELERRFAEGANMSDDEACRLALQD
jgi:predicted ATPase/DNA-binding winged helix-turn-helix (wHTH) protein